MSNDDHLHYKATDDRKVRNALSLERKLELLAAVEREPDRARVDIAKEFGLPASTLNSIVARRNEVESNVQRFDAATKSAKTARYSAVETALVDWLRQVNASGTYVDSVAIRKKAREIAKSLGFAEFTASNGWICRFKARHGVIGCTVGLLCPEDARKRKPVQSANGPDSKRTKCIKDLPKKDRFCWICHREPATLTCHTCPRSFHPSCVNLKVKTLSEWVCPECVRVMAAENMDTRSSGLAPLGAEEFCSLLQFALQRLKQHTHEAFLRPVCTKTYPTYTDYVSHPFDLSILEKNVRWKHYGCTESFLNDARWIYHNCIIFNGYNHKLSMSAKVLMKVCKQEMEEIEVCPDCYKNANTHESWFTEPCRRPHLLVWAKLKGFPYWPAKAMRLREGNVDARFFGAHDRAWVPLSQCYRLSKEYPTDAKNRKKGLQNAMEELEIYIQKYKEKFTDFEYSGPKVPVTQEDIERLLAASNGATSFDGAPSTTSTPKKTSPFAFRPTVVNLSSAAVTSPNDKAPTEELQTGPSAQDKTEPCVETAEERRMESQSDESTQNTPTTRKAPDSVTSDSLQDQLSFGTDSSQNSKPHGIFEGSSELPGELKIRVSEKDMVDLPKKVNRNVESLVSALRKIQRSISTDSELQSGAPEAATESTKENHAAGTPPSSPKAKVATPKNEENHKEPAEDGDTVPSTPKQVADDYREKLKKTILICKEKIGGISGADAEEAAVDEEEADDEEELDEEVEDEQQSKDEKETDVVKEKELSRIEEKIDVEEEKEVKVEGPSEGSSRRDSSNSEGKVPGRAKMKYTCKRNSTTKGLTNGSLELSDSASSDHYSDDKPLSSLLPQKDRDELVKQKFRDEMAETCHNFVLALKETRICWALELKQIMADTEEKNAAELSRAVAETKRKQWCANCWKEAVFYCCWNTSYCDYPCQQAHWPKHMATCTQAAAQAQPATGVAAVVSNTSLTELSLAPAGEKATTVILPHTYQASSTTPVALFQDTLHNGTITHQHSHN
ncbi:MYND-type zinc finger-containing chromatin reader ZMYND8-like isoform X2 [Ornithodoros turicata]|uniref:MYND-type zinc finger-containing chromatin reader ZMYND8-like isoform X2 n=1 Tax=Ornithodoros turicata TaxID=34597 RepID=UPI0031387F67